MAHFYGTLKGQRGEATRCGSPASGLVTHAAGWGGAVRVELYVDEETGQDFARVNLVPWLGRGEHRTLYDGPVSGKLPAECAA